MKPIKIERNKDGSGLSITWENNTTVAYPSTILRRNCPCANCREERGDDAHRGIAPVQKKSMLQVIKNSTEESLYLNNIVGIGNYALGIEWKDGHSAGIYTFEYLQQLIGPEPK